MAENIFDEHIKAANETRKLYPKVEQAAQLVRGALSSGKKILICGNGGSAADAQHFAAELVGRFVKERKGLPAIALTTDTSILTSIGNDYGFEQVFSRQVEALGSQGDVLIAISTSGNSGNILLALNKAHEKGMKSISLLGRGGGKAKGMATLDIIVPSQNTARVQEMHILLLHALSGLVE
jgi:D-sedoheptulose 7-phosphate isomerase